MSKRVAKIDPGKGLYIKLGRAGSWEKECLENGILRFGYKETPFEAAVAGDWDTVRKHWLAAREDAGTATRDVIQIRHFSKPTPTRYGSRSTVAYSGGASRGQASRSTATEKEATG
jgi:hypothetical protein